MTPQLQQFIQLLSSNPPLGVVHYAAKLAFGKTITIREERMSPGMCKFHVLGFEFDAVLHHFTKAEDEDYHDHPYSFTSHVLHGGYVENINENGSLTFRYFHRDAGQSHYVQANTIHKIVRLPDGDCWTLILPEQKVQEPSFYRVEHGVMLRRRWDEKEWREVR